MLMINQGFIVTDLNRPYHLRLDAHDKSRISEKKIHSSWEFGVQVSPTHWLWLMLQQICRYWFIVYGVSTMVDMQQINQLLCPTIGLSFIIVDSGLAINSSNNGAPQYSP